MTFLYIQINSMNRTNKKFRIWNQIQMKSMWTKQKLAIPYLMITLIIQKSLLSRLNPLLINPRMNLRRKAKMTV